MADDGKVIIGTEIDTSGASSGLKKLSTMATAAVGALAGYSVKVGTDFEASMSEVAAISGATGDEIQALTEKARQMGAETQFSAAEASQALKYMAMAGWQTEDMLSGISGIMNLAAASGEDLAMVSDIVTDAMTAFGLSAKDSAHFADVLAMAANASNTDVYMLGESFKYVAPVAGALGYSIEDVSVALGLMANSGIKASQAGTAMRSLLTRLVKPTKASAEAIEALGIEVANADGSVKPLNELLEQLRGSFANLTDAQKAEYAALLAGQEGMSGLLAIVNASESDFQTLTDRIAAADGTAQEMAATMNDNLKGRMELLSSSCEELGLAIYDGISDPLKEAAEWATDAVNEMVQSFQNGKLKGALQSVGKLISDLVKILMEVAKAVIPAVIKALAWVGDNLSWLVPLITAVVTAFTAYKTIDKIVNSALGSVVKNLIACVSQFGIATTAALVYEEALVALKTVTSALTSPVGLLAVGLGALAGIVIACCTSTDEATQAFREQKAALEEEKAATDEAAESFRQLQETQADQIAETESQYAHAQNLWEELKGLADASGNIREQDVERAKVLAELLNPTLGETIRLNNDGTASLAAQSDEIDKLLEKKRAQAILAAKEPTYNQAVAESLALVTRQRELDASISARQATMSSLQAQARQAEIDGNMQLLNTIAGRLDQERQLMQDEQALYADNRNQLKGYYETIADYESTLTAIQQGNYDTRTGLLKMEVDTANATTAEMEKAYEERIGIEQEKYDTMLEQSQEKNSKITQTELEAQRKRVQNEKDAMMQMYAAAIAGGEDLTDASRANAQNILAAYAELPQEQKELAVRSMLEHAKGIESQIPALKNAANMSADEVIASITAHLENGVPEVRKASGEVGDATVSGAQGVVKQKAPGFINTAASMVAEAIRGMRRAADIHSPSRKTAEIGRYMVEGLGKGVDDHEEAAAKRAEVAIQDMVDRMQTAVAAETIGVSRRMSAAEQRRLAFAAVPNAQNQYAEDRPNGKYVANTRVVLNGREIARATAPFIGAQLAWEG